MLVRLREPGARALAARILAAFTREIPDNWARCFTVLTDRKIRVRQPQSA